MTKEDRKVLNFIVFIALFLAGAYFIPRAPFMTQMHEDGHVYAARGSGLEAEQIAPARTRIRGMKETGSTREYVLISGYKQEVIVSGFALLVAWGIGWAVKPWWWLGFFAGAFHGCWIQGAGTTDFSMLEPALIRGWYLVGAICCAVFWLGFWFQRKLRA